MLYIQLGYIVLVPISVFVNLEQIADESMVV